MATVAPDDFFDAEEQTEELFTSAREDLPTSVLSNTLHNADGIEVVKTKAGGVPKFSTPPLEDIRLDDDEDEGDLLGESANEARLSPVADVVKPVPASRVKTELDNRPSPVLGEPEVGVGASALMSPTTISSDGGTMNFNSKHDSANVGSDEEERLEGEDQFIDIYVSDPEKIGEGMSSYLTYRVETKTNLPFFKNQVMFVRRRFSDFLGLQDKLQEKYLHTGRILPPAPEKNVVSAAKLKMSGSAGPPVGTSGALSPGSDTHGHLGVGASSPTDEFVEKRRGALERYLNRTASHPVLRSDPDFRDFLSQEGELPRATQTSALSGAGVKRLFTRVGETVNKMTVKMEENDPWFEEKTQQVESMEIQLKKLHASVEALVQFRRELSHNTATFARAVALLSNCEEHTSLARALSQFAELEEKLDQIYSAQSTADAMVFAELLRDYTGLLGAVKAALHERVKAFQLWQHAQQTLTRKREAKARLELAQRTDKLPQVREEVTEWEAKVERTQEEFEKISKTIRKEMDGFDKNRVRDFRDVIVKYLEALMQHQQEIIRHWESFLPEAQAVVQQ